MRLRRATRQFSYSQSSSIIWMYRLHPSRPSLSACCSVICYLRVPRSLTNDYQFADRAGYEATLLRNGGMYLLLAAVGSLGRLGVHVSVLCGFFRSKLIPRRPVVNQLLRSTFPRYGRNNWINDRVRCKVCENQYPRKILIICATT